MKPMAVMVETGANMEETLSKARAEILKVAADMKLSPALQEELNEQMERTIRQLTEDGPAKTNMKSTIALIKDAEEMLGKAPEAVLGVAKMASQSADSSAQVAAHAFILGGIAADIVSARDLLVAARQRLRDHMDCDCYASSKEKPKQPEAPAVS
jgi:hypothetical protein